MDTAEKSILNFKELKKEFEQIYHKYIELRMPELNTLENNTFNKYYDSENINVDITDHNNIYIKEDNKILTYGDSLIALNFLSSFKKFNNIVSNLNSEYNKKSIPIVYNASIKDIVKSIKSTDSIYKRLVTNTPVKSTYINNANLNYIFYANGKLIATEYKDFENEIFLKSFLRIRKEFPKNTITLKNIELTNSFKAFVTYELLNHDIPEKNTRQLTRKKYSFDIKFREILPSKLFNNTFDIVKSHQSEAFKNAFEIYVNNEKKQYENFCILRGELVSFYYNEKQYTVEKKDTLHKSCMRNSNAVSVYNILKNVVGLLSLLDNTNKLKGRSLYWTGYKINPNFSLKDQLIESNKTNFIDRIYYDGIKTCNHFVTYANFNGLETSYSNNPLKHGYFCVVLPKITLKDIIKLIQFDINKITRLINFSKSDYFKILEQEDLFKLLECIEWPFMDSFSNSNIIEIDGEKKIVLTNFSTKYSKNIKDILSEYLFDEYKKFPILSFKKPNNNNKNEINVIKSYFSRFNKFFIKSSNNKLIEIVKNKEENISFDIITDKVISILTDLGASSNNIIFYSRNSKEDLNSNIFGYHSILEFSKIPLNFIEELIEFDHKDSIHINGHINYNHINFYIKFYKIFNRNIYYSEFLLINEIIRYLLDNKEISINNTIKNFLNLDKDFNLIPIKQKNIENNIKILMGKKNQIYDIYPYSIKGLINENSGLYNCLKILIACIKNFKYKSNDYLKVSESEEEIYLNILNYKENKIYLYISEEVNKEIPIILNISDILEMDFDNFFIDTKINSIDYSKNITITDYISYENFYEILNKYLDTLIENKELLSSILSSIQYYTKKYSNKSCFYNVYTIIIERMLNITPLTDILNFKDFIEIFNLNIMFLNKSNYKDIIELEIKKIFPNK